MPRDANGFYTLPAGNPVVSGTVISSSWANPTMDDMKAVLSDSLSRTGNGAMQSALKAVDGLESAPAYTFTASLTSGIYYDAGSGEVRVAVNSSDVAAFGAGGAYFPALDYWTVRTVSFTAVANKAYLTTGAVTATLPATPATGEAVRIVDGAGTGATNNITIAGNGKNIAGAATLVLAYNYSGVTLVYNGTQWTYGDTDTAKALATAIAAAAGAGDMFNANNLANLANKTTSRTNLGVAIGTDVQAYDVDTAKLDVVQSFTAEQTFKEVKETTYTLTGTDVNPANGTLQVITLTANRTLTSSLSAGQSVTLTIQDGAAYTITWFTVNWIGGAAPTLPTTGRATVEIWVDDDSRVYGMHSGDST